MTQVEFEKKLAELKAQANKELEAMETWQVDTKQRIAAAREMCLRFQDELAKLNAQRQGFHARRMEIERKWKSRIAQFKAENYSETRELENISSYALVKELAKRGWHGIIDNDRQDIPDEHKLGVKEKFAACYQPEKEEEQP